MDNIQSAAQFAALIQQLKVDQFYRKLFLNPMVVELDANESRKVELDIKAGAHFDSAIMTGNFTTLIDDGQGAAEDDGTNHITAEFIDGSNNEFMSSNPVPVDLLLTPGRVLASGITGDPSGHVFWPLPWKHIYGAKGAIVVKFHNAADWTNTIRILWIGRNLLAQQVDEDDF